jgi:two-component system, OmpR family, sensor histidine kinase VicK
MRQRWGSDSGPWGFVGASIVILLIVIGLVGAVALLENERVRDTAERAIAFDVEIEDNGDDLRVAVLNLRHYHRNIVFSGPNDQAIREFDTAYAELLVEIDELEAIGIADVDIPQPDFLHERAAVYYSEFRPAIVLFTTDPTAFNRASDTGLARIDELDRAAEEIDDLGEALTEQSLARVRSATARERIVLILMLSAVALVGIALAVTAGRVVSRLRVANAQEHEASRRLGEALRSKSDFIADASHELRTPLTLIRGNAEIGLTMTTDEEQRQVLDEILRESTRMGRLVEDLLLLARSDAGRIPLEREYIPVHWLLTRLGERAETITRHYERCLEPDLQGEGHLNVDPQRIVQAVSIAVDNASKFAPEGSCVELRSNTAEGSLTLEIVDHGPGIPPEELPLVFERFYQVGERRARKKGGSGLGLAIAKSIVEAHGGEIGIESAAGEGTKLTIRIPLAEEQ